MTIKTPFLVYILPIILSVGLGTLVMSEALDDSERTLNMWQIGDNGNLGTDVMELVGLETTYSVSESIEFQVKIINDPTFDCGDLYITLYKFSGSTKEVITQSGFLNQCYSSDGSYLPVDEYYSEKLNEAGKYEILVEIYDKTYKQTISHTESLLVN
jgi:hypothetical protein